MNCSQKGCEGKIDMTTRAFLRTGCSGCGSPSSPAYPCGECGRLHWADGEPASNRGGNPTFIEDEHIVIRDAKTKAVIMKW